MRNRYTQESLVAAITVRGMSEIGVRWYADVIAGHRASRVVVIACAEDARGGLVVRRVGEREESGTLPEALNRLAARAPIGVVVAEWGRGERPYREAAWAALRLEAPCVYVRAAGRPGPIRNVLVATAGGGETIGQSWIAQKAAAAWGAPLRLFRVIGPGAAGGSGPVSANGNELDAFCSHVCGIRTPLEIDDSPDVAQAILRRAGRDSLLVMGASPALFMADGGTASVPHQVARRFEGPILLLLAPRAKPVSLRRLFWGQLIRTDYRPATPADAVAGLIDALIRHNQLPATLAGSLLARAMRDERSLSSAVDCQTAFPRAIVPGFYGVAASLGICREGIEWDDGTGERTRFVFFLVTSVGYHAEYLATLGRIARVIIRPEVREALLDARSPAEALDILEPRAPAEAAALQEVER